MSIEIDSGTEDSGRSVAQTVLGAKTPLMGMTRRRHVVGNVFTAANMLLIVEIAVWLFHLIDGEP